MPPSSDPPPNPQRPNRRASASHILSAFLTLTSKSTPKISPSETAVQPAYAAPFVDTKHEVPKQTSHSGNGYASPISFSVSEDAPAAVPLTSLAIHGGPPELARLLSQLTRSQPLSHRIRAATKLRIILERYTINNPLAVWSLGEDLLVDSSEEASKAGMTLLLGCANAPQLSAVERRVFYDALETASDRGRHLDLLVEVFRVLTNDGKETEALERDVLSLAAYDLERCFSHVNHERRQRRSNGTSQEGTLSDMFGLVISILKFNAQNLSDEDLAQVVKTVTIVLESTTAAQDVERSMDIIAALLTFSNLPQHLLKQCLGLIADVYRQLPTLKEQAWKVAADVFSSHFGHLAIDIYLDAVRSGGINIKRMIFRGAFRLLAHLLECCGSHGMPAPPIEVLLAAAAQALAFRDRLFAMDLLTFVRQLLFQDGLRMLLDEMPEWATFVDCIMTCADILDLNQFTLESSSAVGRSEQDEARSIRLSETLPPAQSRIADKDPVDAELALQNFNEVVIKLSAILTSIGVIQRDAVVELFLGLASRLGNGTAEVLITYCGEEQLLWPASTGWLSTCEILIHNFIHDSSRPSRLRVLAISTFRQAWDVIEHVSKEQASQLALLLLRRMDAEVDGVVLDLLASFASVVIERADEGLFGSILTIFRVTVFQRRSSQSTITNLSPPAGYPVSLPAPSQPSPCCTATKQIIRMFIHSLDRSARKTEALFSFVLKIAGSPDCPVDARMCAIKLLFRLRAFGNYSLYIRPLPESERIAAILCRTAETAPWTDHSSNTNEAREGGFTAVGGFSKGQRFLDVKKLVAPLWFYPGPKGLPEEPSPQSSIFAFAYQDLTVKQHREDVVVLPLALWLETVINLLQQQDTDWEIYSYVIVHLGAQASNQNLFRGCIRQIQFLRSVLCEQIRAASFREPPSHTSLKKADVAVCLFHTLTMLIGYHNHFARSEEDELVRTFVLGIGSWDRTSKWCIHALSVCCHELPFSVSKMLDSIIQKMSQMVTQSQVAIHILEFLVMLARLPNLYKNFREDEYKMVFGVSFRYLQYARDMQERDANKDVQLNSRINRTSIRHSDGFRELRMPNDIENKSKSNIDVLPQYVYALAFHVITFWFMNLRLDDRPMYMPWISKNLTYRSADGKDVVEDQGLVTMDMMDKVAFTDRDETVYNPGFASESDGEIVSRSWIIGLSLLSVETAGRTGVSQMIKRRPSGTRYSIFRPGLTSPPRHQVPITTGLAADAFYTSSYTGVLPQDVIQEFYSSYNLLDARAPRPILLPDDDAVARAIGAFDRNSTVDGHKVGVIYIDEGQDGEADILSNTHGSADYTAFVGRLGFLTRLKGATFNAQGLDRTEDTDGLYAYCWRDRATEIVFHVTTMMPTDLENDPQCIKKKSHVGNDFVNIVWNNSGADFHFDTFPSAFNYVYIVITPESMDSFTTLRDKDHTPDRFYKVQVLSAKGFPEMSPAAESKLLGAKALPDFVRLLALNASVFSLVWQNKEGGEHYSPWRNRLREIKRLRDKYASSDEQLLHLSSGLATGSKVIPPSTIEKAQNETLSGGALASPPDRGGSSLGHRLSHATFAGSEDLSRSSLTSNSAGDKGGHGSDR